MNAKDIIIDWLKEHDFDGLCRPKYYCGCLINDLIPCGSDPCFCEPGKKRMKDSDWEIYVP